MIHCIDTLLPEELRGDAGLDAKFDDLQARYNALFIDNRHEFSFVGFKNESDRAAFWSDWTNTVREFLSKLNGKYVVQGDVRLDVI